MLSNPKAEAASKPSKWSQPLTPHMTPRKANCQVDRAFEENPTRYGGSMGAKENGKRNGHRNKPGKDGKNLTWGKKEDREERKMET